ncbi:hypothetical protein LUZ63_017365 [Rhynchospora breviuscula]|uniref:NAD-dependent epimerase/dehydratase domain-containing protein n=1 Tax=Rhynchospora breviuscula TaxID=2022672 RepID=A0A9Q0C2B4_9POAL|nr:hypothetical protein LUZ63_017365 [Rhynchospora breviuscula]
MMQMKPFNAESTDKGIDKNSNTFALMHSSSGNRIAAIAHRSSGNSIAAGRAIAAILLLLKAASSSDHRVRAHLTLTGTLSTSIQLRSSRLLPRKSERQLDQPQNRTETNWGTTDERERERMSGNTGNGEVVCVTGASGYIASWLVKLLLQRGYTVRATIRDPSDPKRTEHLLALDGASERLHLFKADLLEEGSFDSVIDGCSGVFHTASPFFLSSSDPQAELIDPAVKGTLNVLKSCAKASTVKRVIVTSSMAAVEINGKPKNPDVVVDETWFSIPEFCEKSKLWYPLSKTLAEEAAWKFSKENGLDLVTINPGMVIGPLLQPTLNASSAAILNLINGSKKFQNASVRWVNVKDVALAHILAYEVPSASGRYLLVERVAHYSEVIEIIHELYPSLSLPEKCADDKPFVPIYLVSQERAKKLGVDFSPLKTNIKETIESLRDKGFVTF